METTFDEKRQKVLAMLLSPDMEIVELGVLTFCSLITNHTDYNDFRGLNNYDKVCIEVRRRIRFIFINSHGKVRRKYKNKYKKY